MIYYLPQIYISLYRLGQVCSHVSGLLFTICRFIQEGLEEVPEDKTCTEFQCGWKGHAAAKTPPAKLEDIKIVK